MKSPAYGARLGLWLAAGGLIAAVGSVSLRALADSRPGARAASVLERLLAPVAGLAASVEWTRADYALRQGRAALFYSRAETALRIDPGDPRGWIFLAHHFVYERAAFDREPDVDARRRWILAGLAVLDRGETSARDPAAAAEIAFERGIACAFLASLPDEQRAWPASAKEAWNLAAEAFERAARAGRRQAAEAGSRARASAAGAARPGG